MSTSTPKITRGYALPWLIARFSPGSRGAGIGRPAVPPVNDVLVNTTASIAAANPRVTTARFTPRSRSAGRPMINPTGTAQSPARISDHGKPMPHPLEMCPSVKPPIPAIDIWASDTWPT